MIVWVEPELKVPRPSLEATNHTQITIYVCTYMYAYEYLSRYNKFALLVYLS